MRTKKKIAYVIDDEVQYDKKGNVIYIIVESEQYHITDSKRETNTVKKHKIEENEDMA